MKFTRALLAAALLMPVLGWAQAYPARPVSIVVPYPPGGLIDKAEIDKWGPVVKRAGVSVE
jgi:tripartite-type tricarboxylate transporter receptor subunit TctC